MNLAQWDEFRRKAEDPRLFQDKGFIRWLWEGKSPEGSGIKYFLEVLAYETWVHLCNRHAMYRAQAKDKAVRAVGHLSAPTMQAQLVREVQKQAQELVAIVEEDPAKKFALVEKLRSPDYILWDMARDVAISIVDRICQQLKSGSTPTKP